MQDALAEVRSQVEPYIAKTQPIPEGQEKEVDKLWRFLTTVNVATLYSSEEYAAVLDKLDAEFWNSLQDDRDLNRQLFSYLSGSAYKIGAANARDAKKRTDPQLMAEMWPKYQNAITVYRQLTEQWPELEERFFGNRRQLAALLNVVKSQANCSSKMFRLRPMATINSRKPSSAIWRTKRSGLRANLSGNRKDAGTDCALGCHGQSQPG